MTITNIPAVKIFICDCCGTELRLTPLDSMPVSWATLTFSQRPGDVPLAPTPRLLCDVCAPLTLTAIQNVVRPGFPAQA